MLTARFTLPFILPLMIILLSSHYPYLAAALAIALLFSFPFILMKFWKCEPLPAGEIKNALDEVAKKANFKHAGLKRWTIMKGKLTAGIVGIFPFMRYVLFSDSLLNRLSLPALSAILAHEIGHAYYRHLLIIPFVLMGIFLLTDLTFSFLPVTHEALSYLAWFLIFALFIRVIFGFFSRLFERQADLHGLKLGQPISWMIEALEEVSRLSFRAADKPDWLHGTINERINFLKKVQEQPELARSHTRKTTFFIIIFIVIGLLMLYFTR